MSTGFEAVMGYLHMTEDIARLEELIAWCIDEVEKRNLKILPRAGFLLFKRL